MGQSVGVGVVGLGSISGEYLASIDRLSSLRLVAVADLDVERGEELARSMRGVVPATVEHLCASPQVDVVVNLTPPSSHAEVAHLAIAGGKSVYNEKPFALSVTDALSIVDAGLRAGVRVGGAPDTVLGTGVQTARDAVDSGLLGTPTSANATFVCAGHEAWHPNPDFYYSVGGGPLLDMGPYYITALVNLLGPVVSVVGAGNAPRKTRTIVSGPRAGQEIPVGVLTHVSGVVTHESGALSTLTLSFDAPASTAPPIEIHGPRGSLAVPDPNTFDGLVRFHGVDAQEWRDLPTTAGYTRSGRGLGVAELMSSPSRDSCRTDASLAVHVLDVMESLLVSTADDSRRIAVTEQVAQPHRVPLAEQPTLGRPLPG